MLLGFHMCRQRRPDSSAPIPRPADLDMGIRIAPCVVQESASLGSDTTVHLTTTAQRGIRTVLPPLLLSVGLFIGCSSESTTERRQEADHSLDTSEEAQPDAAEGPTIVVLSADAAQTAKIQVAPAEARAILRRLKTTGQVGCRDWICGSL